MKWDEIPLKDFLWQDLKFSRKSDTLKDRLHNYAQIVIYERSGVTMSKIYKNNYYESEELDETMILPITLDDGTEMDCEVLAIFPVGEHQYIAMLPLTDDAADIFLYRFVPVGEEEFNLEGIEDDDEYEAVVDVFDMLLDDAEFDAMVGDED